MRISDFSNTYHFQFITILSHFGSFSFILKKTIEEIKNYPFKVPTTYSEFAIKKLFRYSKTHIHLNQKVYTFIKMYTDIYIYILQDDFFIMGQANSR